MKTIPRGALALLALLLLAVSPASADFAAGIRFYDVEDDAAALRELLPLADTGNAEAQFKVGSIYDRNKGVPRDAEKAFHYYIMSADAGNNRARNNAGAMLVEGDGTENSVELGLSLLTQAANAGNVNAMDNLGAYHIDGKRMPVDYVTAVYWYRRAAELDFAPSQFGLGLLLIGGRGTKRDFAEGYKWLFLAEENGNAHATKTILDLSNFIEKKFMEAGRSRMIKWRRKGESKR